MARFDQKPVETVGFQVNAVRDIVIKGEGQSQDYKEYILLLIRKYDRKALFRKIIHNTLQFVIFFGSASAAIIIAIPNVPKFIPILLSSTAALATAVTSYYKFGNRSRDFQILTENIALEYHKFTRGDFQRNFHAL